LRKVADRALTDVVRRGYLDSLCGRLFPDYLQRVGDPGSTGELLLEGLAGGDGLEALEERLPLDRRRVADLEAGKSGHQLAGPALADAEQSFDGLAVEVADVERAQFPENLIQAVKPGGLGRQAGAPATSLREGAVRHNAPHGSLR
jgi:hypothetical protein